jgi:hypothetical protein
MQYILINCGIVLLSRDRSNILKANVLKRLEFDNACAYTKLFLCLQVTFWMLVDIIIFSMLILVLTNCEHNVLL